MDRGLNEALARFPEYEHGIHELAQRDEQFRELCADYGECLAALRRFQDQGPSKQVEQYAEMRAALEQELLAGIRRLDGDRPEMDRVGCSNQHGAVGEAKPNERKPK